MDRNARSHHRQTLGGVQSRARRAQAVDYFNILTSPELLDITEAHLPEHRERLYRKHWIYTVADFVDAREDRLLANGIDV